jgi:hypothetical protein
VPLADTPQKRDGLSSPEQVNSTGGDVPEALLFHLVCAQEMERGELYATGYVVLFQRVARGDFGFLCLWERRLRGGAGKPAVREVKEKSQGETPVIKANSVFNQSGNSRHDENLSGKTFPVPSVRSPPASPRPRSGPGPV